MFFCAISGEVPTEPVIAPSGHVFEKRLIEKYIAENGIDPIAGSKLEASDLIAVKASPSSAPPRPPNFTSIPAILNALQNEWDALMLETFALRQQYNANRQELSHALYQQDAATRVVARLIKERDAAREALANVQTSMGITPAQDVEMEEANAMPEDTTAIIDETLKELSSTRKKRKMPADYVSVDDVKEYKAKQTIPSLHASSPAGINAIAISSQNQSVFATGGNDKVVQVYDSQAQKVLHTLKGHTKKVNHVLWQEDESGSLIFSASADKTARIWGYDEQAAAYVPRQTFKTHKGDVTGIGIHPSKKLLALASADKTYSIHDLTTLQTVYHSSAFDTPIHSLAFHPDGHFIGLGTSNSSVLIIDLRTGAAVAELQHAGEDAAFNVHTVAFSENGWQMAAPGAPDGGVVSLWDLKKQKATLQLDLGEGFSVNKLAFDYSATLLGVAGSSGARIYLPNKTKAEVWREDGHSFSDLVFGNLGQSLWAAGGREVHSWGI